MSKTLYIHGHLIIDEYKQYLDGSILVEDNHIVDVYHDSFINEEYKIVDLKGNIVMYNYNSFNFNLISNKLNENTIGLIIKPEELTEDLITKVKEPNIKLLLEGSNLIPNFDYDGIYNLFVSMNYDGINPTLCNEAFKNEKYVFITPSLLDINTLKLIVNNIDSNKIILLGDINSEIKILNSIHVDYNDILKFSILNKLKLFNLDRLEGTIKKGKKFNLVYLDEKLNEVKING